MTEDRASRGSDRPRGRSRLAGNFSLAAVAVLATLLLCELLLRVLGVS
jgi:hypothetical protein